MNEIMRIVEMGGRGPDRRFLLRSLQDSLALESVGWEKGGQELKITESSKVWYRPFEPVPTQISAAGVRQKLQK